MVKHKQVADIPAFMKVQMQFTGHIRNPNNQPRPADVNQQRMAVYRDLIYNNIENFLSSCFPVIRSIYTDEHWHKMVGDFFVQHSCETPYFLKISEEFIDYLQHQRQPHTEDPAGLLELAHYEWIELALSISDEEVDLGSVNIHGDLLKSHPVISPLAWSLAYQFPVHKMSRDFLPVKVPENLTCLIIYRDPLYDIHFMEINAVTTELLNQLENNPAASGYEILQNIAERLNANDPETIISAGLNSMKELQARGIILGTN